MQSNRPKISVFIATSIDGYIAKKNHDIDWLVKFPPPNKKGEASDCGFSEFFSNIDVLVMRRKTYDTVSHFDTWPYQGKRVVVFTSTLKTIHKEAEVFSGKIETLIEKLHSEGCKNIYVDGGTTISAFLNAGLIDELIISIIPIVLGDGIPLFSKIHNDHWFQLKSSKTFSNGLIQMRYEANQK